MRIKVGDAATEAFRMWVTSKRQDPEIREDA